MERHDISRVELHASEQKFIHVMTSSYLDRILRPEELRWHLEAIRDQWRAREDPYGVWALALLFIEDLYKEAVYLIHSELRD